MTSNHHIAIEQAAETVGAKKVEVTVRGDQAIIQMLTYADGIGWFAQKTITVDAEMLDLLADQFAAARGKIEREGDSILSAEVLEF